MITQSKYISNRLTHLNVMCKGFSVRISLKIYMKTHIKEMKYHSSHCDKNFTQNYQLTTNKAYEGTYWGEAISK